MMKTISQLYDTAPSGALIELMSIISWSGHCAQVDTLNKLALRYQDTDKPFALECEKTASFLHSRLAS